LGFTTRHGIRLTVRFKWLDFYCGDWAINQMTPPLPQFEGYPNLLMFSSMPITRLELAKCFLNWAKRIHGF
jgi:hypothetical protein